MSKIVGIDLGTTNSCVAVVENGEPIVIPNAEGARTTPSVVGFTESGERRVGQVAKRQAVTNARNTVYGIKRLMGRPFDSEATRKQIEHVPYEIVATERGDSAVAVLDHQYTPPEISAMVLETMRAIAESYIGSDITEAVVTVPAYFDDAQRQATKAAGKIAGLEVKRIINEPTAAAIAYGFDRKATNERIVVYDLGGGTFDVSILELSDGVFSVRAVGGDTYLGGEDFDDVVIDYLAQRFQEESGIDLLEDRIALQRLKEQAERARHELSSSLETEINLPFIASDATGPKHLVLTFKRHELELLVEDLVERTLAPCDQALKDANLSTSDIDEIILVGGMTRMPLVQKRVEEFFGKKPHKGVNPDEVVAVGAALHGASLSGEVQEVLLLDVTPLSLGVETGGGVFTKLIPRNTTIPTHKSEVFTTSVDNQPFVPIHVLQGEREMAGDNKSLARFELTGIPPAPRGVPQIQVNFDIDAEGILHVSATDLGTRRAQKVSVVPSSGLTEDEIKQIVDSADQYRQSDEKRRELAELRNNAEGLLYTSERACDECAEIVDAAIIKQVREDIAYLRDLIGGSGDAIAIRDALQQLEQSAYKIAEAMYGSADAAAAPEAAPEGTGASLKPETESAQAERRGRARMSDDAEARAALQAVLFDLDGVLVDTAALHLQAYRSAFRAHGFTFPQSLHPLVRAGQARAVVIAAAGLPPSLRGPIAAAKGTAMLELLRAGGVAPIAGALEFVSDVRARGLRTAVASNSSLAVDVLRAASALSLFDVVVSGGPDGARPKPAPDLYEAAARQLGVRIERCLVIEDNESGAQAGRAAGARVVCIGQAPERPVAHEYVPDFAALSRRLRSLL